MRVRSVFGQEGFRGKSLGHGFNALKRDDLMPQLYSLFVCVLGIGDTMAKRWGSNYWRGAGGRPFQYCFVALYLPWDP